MDERPDRDLTRKPLASLPYRNPVDDRAPISGRVTFRVVRWAAYGSIFLGLAGMILTRGLANRWVTTGGLLLFFLALTALCAFMIVATLRDASRRKP